jgi:hypothetical protein
MARLNYFNKGDLYSEWHRNIQDDSFKMLDLDCIEYSVCSRCKGKTIHFIAETCMYKGSLYKNTDMTRQMANMMGVTAYLIFYCKKNSTISTQRDEIMELGYDPNLIFKIAKIDHLRSSKGYIFEDFTSEQWLSYLKELRASYICNSLECTKWRK